MRKAIVYIQETHGDIVDRFFPGLPANGDFPPLPGQMYVCGTYAIKFHGDWLPEKFECKEGETIQNASVEEMRKLIGGVK